MEFTKNFHETDDEIQKGGLNFAPPEPSNLDISENLHPVPLFKNLDQINADLERELFRRNQEYQTNSHQQLPEITNYSQKDNDYSYNISQNPANFASHRVIPTFKGKKRKHYERNNVMSQNLLKKNDVADTSGYEGSTQGLLSKRLLNTEVNGLRTEEESYLSS